jgi:rubrerythrin
VPGLPVKGFTVKEALNRAIAMEEQSHSLYTWAAGKVENLGSRRLFEELALEEQRHKEKLQSIRDDEAKFSEFIRSESGLVDLKVIDHLVDVELSENMSFQEILIYAGKREKYTFEYYDALSKGLRDVEVKELFKALASEELKHKYRIEKLYDEEVLRET